MKFKDIISGILVIAIIVAVAVVVRTIFPSQEKVATDTVTGDQAVITMLSPSISSVDVGQTQTIRWTASNYSPETVSIRLIRKVSDSPAQYEVVRTITENAKNDGKAVWVPASTDIGDNLYLEIGCANTNNACSSGVSGSAIAVTDTGKFSNTAAVYQSIESENNN